MMRGWIVLVLALAGPASAQSAAPDITASARQRAVSDGFYIYTLPLLEVARRRDAQIATTGANRWKPMRVLADDTFRDVTTPNNDTIYAMAFLDLRNGPARISVPAAGRRYVSVHLMDAYSNAIGYAGTRASAGKAEAITIVGPSTKVAGISGRVIRSGTPWVWAIARVLVTAPNDLPAAIGVQDRITLTAAAPGPLPTPAPRDDADAETLRVAAARLIAENPPPAADAATIASFRAAGLLDTSKSMSATATSGFADARTRARALRRPGEVVNGWIYPKPGLGSYGIDYAYRASVAVNGLGAMTPVEAMYLRSAAPTASGLFDGNLLYRLHFDSGKLPPVDAFWSLSMYERTADGGFYFVPNGIKRYAIGDRTPGLVRNADGSVDLWIGNRDPGSERRSNWLPAPAGPFALSLRAYLPQAALREGRWRAPAVIPVE